MDYEKVVKIAQSLSFTTFLILCLVVMSYGMVRLYTDIRVDATQVQVSLQSMSKLDQDVGALVQRVDRLVAVCYPRSSAGLPGGLISPVIPTDR